MRQAILSGLIIMIGAYLLVNVGKRVYDLYRTSDRLTIAQQKLDAERVRNEELKKEIAYRESEFYVEKEAREKLSLARPGERVAVITGIEEPKEEVKEERSDPNWKQWYNLFFEDYQ